METVEKKGSVLKRHLEDAGEGYFEHLLFTLRIGGLLFVTGAAIVIHGLMPFIFTAAGSNMIAHVNELLSARRARQKTAS